MSKQSSSVEQQLIDRFGISRKYIPPFIGRVTFLDINWGQPNARSEQPGKGRTINLPGEFDFYDEVQQKMIRIKNLTTAGQILREVNGSAVYVDDVAEIMLNEGKLVIDTFRQPFLYLALALHPNNASNKFRDPSKKALFRDFRVEIDNPDDFLAKQKYAAVATEMIMQMDMSSAQLYIDVLNQKFSERVKDNGFLSAIAQRDRISPLKVVLAELVRFAKDNPVEFFEHSPSEEDRNVGLFRQAEGMEMLYFSDIDREWKWRKSNRAILEVEPGSRPDLAFIAFLNEGGQRADVVKGRIERRLRYGVAIEEEEEAEALA